MSELLAAEVNLAEVVAELDADSTWAMRDSEIAKYVYRVHISKAVNEEADRIVLQASDRRDRFLPQSHRRTTSRRRCYRIDCLGKLRTANA